MDATTTTPATQVATVKLLIGGKFVESKTTEWRDIVNPPPVPVALDGDAADQAAADSGVLALDTGIHDGDAQAGASPVAERPWRTRPSRWSPANGSLQAGRSAVTGGTSAASRAARGGRARRGCR